jgi:hypothetical protein
MEKDRDLKAPLVKAAVEVRLRFVEQAREAVLNVSRGEVDLAIIENGNKAAHHANGEMDAELFTAVLVPEEYKEAATEIYKNLY